MSIGDTAKIVTAALALAFLCESMTEYLFGAVVAHTPKLEPFRWLLMYIALLAGVGLAFYYQLDLIAIILGESRPVGFLLSGLVIGRGANFLHDFISRYIIPAKE